MKTYPLIKIAAVILLSSMLMTQAFAQIINNNVSSLRTLQTEDFETDDFMKYNWEFNKYPWAISTGMVHGGDYSAESTNRKDNTDGSMWVTMNVISDGDITFYYNVSSEFNHDNLNFYIDGESKGSWSGVIDWTSFSTPVTAGIHTFKWSYTKDDTISRHNDCAWIDDITFPSVNLDKTLQPVTNLFHSTVGYQVTLTWNESDGATQYIVLHDGVPVATVEEGSFFEALAESGSHKYSVIATDGYRVSKPTSTDVNINHFQMRWTPDTHLYEDNMSVTAVIKLNNVEQYVNTLEVGAFCGGECRGSQVAQYFPPTGKYILSLMVYGIASDAITFRIYDHVQDIELDMTCNSQLTFEPNAIHGGLTSPYILNFENGNNQCTTLAEGNNWYSTYIVIDGSEGLGLIEEGLASSATMVKSQTSYTQYYDGYGWFGTLSTANNEQMYIINMTEDHELCLSGSTADPSEHPIALHQNWNWIGYPVGHELSVDDAFEGVTLSSNDIVKSQNSFSTYYNGYGWFGGLNTMTPGNGFMLYQARDISQDLVYPSTRNGDEILEANVTAQDNHYVPNVNKFPTNMSVIAAISINGDIQRNENLEVAAFCKGEVRGSTRPMYFEPLNEYVILLTVYGNEGDNLAFKLFDTETGLEYQTVAKENLTYSENAIIGTLAEPLVLNFDIANGVGENEINCVSVYPNPAQCGDEITLSTTCETVEVFNSIGIKIAEYQNIDRIKAINVAGSYIIRMTNGDAVNYNKIIVK